MEQILELFKNLDTFQWVLIGIGVYLLWPTLKSTFVGFVTKESPIVNPLAPVDAPDEGMELTALVSKWEMLNDACRDLGLEEACDTLKIVFPMLIEPYEGNLDEFKEEDS